MLRICHYNVWKMTSNKNISSATLKLLNSVFRILLCYVSMGSHHHVNESRSRSEVLDLGARGRNVALNGGLGVMPPKLTIYTV